MANYKKYAENLIGNWEKDIYEPQKEVTKAIYQTNWNKLSNDYADVRDKLERNFELARNEYTNTLNDIQNSSFNRMNNANIDLANRGLSSSGMLDLITQGDTQTKGESVDRALANLLKTNNASLEGLREGVTNLGEKQTSLAGDLAGDMGDLTDADAKNNQQYADLLAGIAQSAAQRAASRAGRSGGKSKEEKELDETKRKILIADTITSTDLTDQQKKEYLNTYLDVPGDVAIAVVDGYNNNTKLQTKKSEIAKLEEKSRKQAQSAANWRLSGLKSNTPFGNLYATVFNVPNAMNYYTNQRLDTLKDDVSGLTYTDLAELLYGKK